MKLKRIKADQKEKETLIKKNKGSTAKHDTGKSPKRKNKKKNSSSIKTKTGSQKTRREHLTLSEIFRLNSLKKQLEEGDKAARPETSQDTMTFEDIYRDGTCRVRKGYYTRMVKFEDMNYELLDDDGQEEVHKTYSRFINYFEPDIHVQLFLFNRRMDLSLIKSRFEVKKKDDGYDDIREEFTTILKDQSKRGTNGVIKDKYLIFGIEAAGYKEAKVRLGNIENDVIKNLEAVGTRVSTVDGRARVRIMYEFFNQYTISPFRFSFDQMKQSGNTVKDYIAPPGFDLRYPSRFKCGRMYGSAYYLNLIAPVLTDEIIKRLLDVDENLSVSIHMTTLAPQAAMKLIKKNLSDVQSSKINEQKKAVRQGYDMDIMPADILTDEKDLMDQLRIMGSNNEKIIHISILVCLFGRTKKEHEALIQRVSGIAQTLSCELKCLMYKQEAGINAVSPIGINETKESRTLTTSAAAVLIPFNTQELFMGGEALYYGINSLSNNMIIADRKKLRTPNGVILGTPGSGKSFSAKREIMGSFMMTDDDIIIVDPEGEYFPLVHALGGEVIHLSTDSTDYLNPMDIQISHKDDSEALKLKSDFIITLCDAIAGGVTGLANDEKGIIDNCIRDIYRKYFEDPRPETMPTLEDLYIALLHYIPKDSDETLAMDARQKATRIANSLVLYVHGSQNYFNHRTTVDSMNRIICFDIKDLGVQLKQLGMLIAQDAVWNRVSYNRTRRIATRYYCDEFHLLLRDKQTASYAVEMWKRFRKWGGIPTGLTQNVGDFLRSEEIEGILGNSDFIYLLNQNAKDQLILKEKLNLSDRQMQKVTNAEQGCGLIIFDNVVIPFTDRYSTDSKTYRIMSTKPMEAEIREE